MPFTHLYTVGGNLATLYNGATALGWRDPYNPLNLPPRTLRVKFDNNVIEPVTYYQLGNWTYVSANTWDWTYDTDDWYGGLEDLGYFSLSNYSIIAGNTESITSMNQLFQDYGDPPPDRKFSITACAPINLKNVVNANRMFHAAWNLLDMPALDYSHLLYTESMFERCTAMSSVIDNTFNSVVHADEMFNDCWSMSAYPQDSLLAVSSVSFTFTDCSSMTSNAIDFIQSHTNVVNSTGCFRRCYSLSDSAQATAQYPDWF